MINRISENHKINISKHNAGKLTTLNYGLVRQCMTVSQIQSQNVVCINNIEYLFFFILIKSNPIKVSDVLTVFHELVVVFFFFFARYCDELLKQ